MNCLGGEVLKQRDLFVGERANFPTPNCKGTQEPSFFAQRSGELGSGTHRQHCQPSRIARLNGRPRGAIDNVHDVLALREAARTCLGVGSDWVPVARKFRYASMRDRREVIAIVCEEHPSIRAAYSDCFLQHRIEHRCEFAGRRIDDTQNFSRRGLLL